MRQIQKGKEPRELTAHRSSHQASYGNLTAEALQALRQSLAAEQGYLCCYCLGRIDPTPNQSGQVEGMKIEHWTPQSDEVNGKARSLDYANLLGACPGKLGVPPGSPHCDTSKGSQPITLDPRAPSPHPSRIRYTAEGAIQIDDPILQEDIVQRLKLNADHLKTNRRKALDQFLQQAQRQLGPGGDWTTAKLQQLADRLRQTDSQGRLLPYVEVMLFWLRKRDRAVR